MIRNIGFYSRLRVLGAADLAEILPTRTKIKTTAGLRLVSTFVALISLIRSTKKGEKRFFQTLRLLLLSSNSSRVIFVHDLFCVCYNLDNM